MMLVGFATALVKFISVAAMKCPQATVTAKEMPWMHWAFVVVVASRIWMPTEYVILKMIV